MDFSTVAGPPDEALPQHVKEAADALVAEAIDHPIMPSLRTRGLTAAEGVQAIRLANRLRAEGGAQ